jgi:hypothetical protein
MFINKLKWVAVVLLTVTMLGAGAAWVVRQAAGKSSPPDKDSKESDLARHASPAPASSSDKDGKHASSSESESDSASWVFPDVPKNDVIYHARVGVIVGVDAKQSRILVRLQRTKVSAPFAIDANARISFTAPAGMRRTFAYKLEVGELRKGMQIQEIERSEDGRTFLSFECCWPTINGKLEAIDTDKKTVKIDKAEVQGSTDVGVLSTQKTFTVSRDGEIVVEEPGNGRAFLLDFDSMPVGRNIALILDTDKSIRLAILHPDNDIYAVVRSVDVSKRTILVALKGDRNEVELGLEVKESATIRLEGKSVALDELKKDMRVLLRLDGDRRAITGLWALPAARR